VIIYAAIGKIIKPNHRFRLSKGRLAMRKYEMYPGYHDLFKYFGTTEIERIRIKGATAIRRDWIVFKTVDEALEYFNEKCGRFEGYYH
jgi:hypothetical protein